MYILRRKTLSVAVLAATSLMPSMVFATNGMNMEGYGPVSTAMGGAAMAFDSGTSAMMSNPATLGLMSEGTRLDVGIGNLRPDVSSTATQPPGIPTAESGGDSYLMPTVGFARKAGALTFGAGVFSQGGMGTEYEGNSFMSAGTGDTTRSEIGVGRVIFPVAYNVNDKLSVGGSLDYVWGGMDIRMAMPVADPNFGAVPGTLADFSPAFGGSQVLGSADFSPSFAQALGGMVANGATAVRIDFSDDNDFTGNAKTSGFGGKLGFTYAVNPKLTVGGSYHSKVSLDDWEGSGTFSGYNGNTLMGSISGQIRVKDFHWPSQFGLGMAYQASDKLTVVADVKTIQWAETMENFNMTMIADGNNAAFGLAEGDSVDISMKQNWDDQLVLSVGLQNRVNDKLTLRGGVNFADSPVPDEYLNPLFPAIVKNHFTGGFSYAVGKSGEISGSLAYAPKVSQTNTFTGVKSEHAQTNLQLMYSHRF